MDAGGDSGGAERAGRGLCADTLLLPASMGSSLTVRGLPPVPGAECARPRWRVCGDPSLRAVLWHILVEDFDLHGALQDDALALLTDGLWGRADLALRCAAWPVPLSCWSWPPCTCT